MLKGPKHCLNLDGSIFVIFLITLEKELVVYEILRLLVNILTPDEVFSLSKSECLMQPVQMLSSQNQKIFSELFSAFSKVT